MRNNGKGAQTFLNTKVVFACIRVQTLTHKMQLTRLPEKVAISGQLQLEENMKF